MRPLRFFPAFAVTLALFSVGCADNSRPNIPDLPTATLAAGGATNVYVVNYTANNVAQLLTFPISGTTASVLSLPGTFSATSVAVDSAGLIYLGGEDSAAGDEILVYPAGASGTTAPLRTITSTAFTVPDALAIDQTGQLYVLSSNGVSVFPASSSGAVTPTRQITGSSTGILVDLALAVDSAGSIYVASCDQNYTTGTILVFNSAANGNTAPVRSITYPGGIVTGVATDSTLNVWAAEDSSSSAQIAVYAAGASGSATPLKTISGTVTAISNLGGLVTDGANNTYVINEISSGSFSLMGYGPSVTGNMYPGYYANPGQIYSPSTIIAVH